MARAKAVAGWAAVTLITVVSAWAQTPQSGTQAVPQNSAQSPAVRPATPPPADAQQAGSQGAAQSGQSAPAQTSDPKATSPAAADQGTMPANGSAQPPANSTTQSDDAGANGRAATVPPADAQPANMVAPPNAAGADDTPRERNTAALPPSALVSTPRASNFDEVVDRTIEREHAYIKNLQQYQPLVETYIQDLQRDPDLGSSPSSDNYFLGRLQLTSSGASDQSYLAKPGLFRSMLKKINSLYSLEFLPLGFAQMVLIDNTGFDRAHYEFKFLRREFLGDTRCIVIDVYPKKGVGAGRFSGRMWVEDQDYNVVRFNGTYTGNPHWSRFLHFDSWRLNMQPGVWLPAYIYSEESDIAYRFGTGHLKYKALTRLWGYDLKRVNGNSEMTEVVVEQANVKDQSASGQDATPVESNRDWQRQAEDNALDRLTRAGLVAPPGEVDKVLETVVNNLEITNKLDIQPEVRCRVMLTTPLESFSVGHTIVLSRGLIDVLPDEASLAAVLAHELAHIALGHHFDTKWAFSDRMLFKDEDTFRKMNFHQKPEEEAAADAKAMEFMKNSPYADKLDSVGLFVRALALREHKLPNLIKAHLGNTLLVDKDRLRMAPLEGSSPQLQMRNVQQLPALPMGSRLHMDPWSDRVELVKSKPTPLISANEKLLFEVTPVFPYITRYGGTPSNLARAGDNK